MLCIVKTNEFRFLAFNCNITRPLFVPFPCDNFLVFATAWQSAFSDHSKLSRVVLKSEKSVHAQLLRLHSRIRTGRMLDLDRQTGAAYSSGASAYHIRYYVGMKMPV